MAAFQCSVPAAPVLLPCGHAYLPSEVDFTIQTRSGSLLLQRAQITSAHSDTALILRSVACGVSLSLLLVLLLLLHMQVPRLTSCVP
jgi:hypothetical protein